MGRGIDEIVHIVDKAEIRDIPARKTEQKSISKKDDERKKKAEVLEDEEMPPQMQTREG